MMLTDSQSSAMRALVDELLENPPDIAQLLDYLCYRLMGLELGEEHRAAALEVMDVGTRLNEAYFKAVA